MSRSIVRLLAIVAFTSCLISSIRLILLLEKDALEKGAPVPSNYYYNGPFKVYSKWQHDFPCTPAEPNWNTIKVQRSPSKEGLLYVREMKTGSSTLAGVLLGIAHRKAPRNLPCKHRVDHSSALQLKYGRRNKKKSFLVSLLREPTRRAMSDFFHFEVSAKGIQPTDANFIEFLEDPEMSNYYVQDLTTRPIDLENMDNYDTLVQDILDEYNFIGISERMDESLVVLKLLLDLDFGDILYMSAKKHGSFTPAIQQECVYLIPSFVSPGMKEYFASPEWQEAIAADLALYQAANASLDKTIDSLGRNKFEKQLEVFKRLREQAQEECTSRTIYRCNAAGEFVGQNSTCLLWDVGCGYDCLAEFASKIRI